MSFDHRSISVFAVDKWVFERDIDRGLLGEGLASELILPFHALRNSEYLHQQELLLKKRLELELLQNLVTDFPESSHEFRIDPEYFMYETFLIRARLYPPMLYWLENAMKHPQDLQQSLQGFEEALDELKNEGAIQYSGRRVVISKEFISNAEKGKSAFANLLRTGQRALFASMIGMLPQVMNVFSTDREYALSIQKIFPLPGKAESKIRDPEAHVYVKTASGLVPLANRIDITAFSKKILSPSADAKVRIENIGGILNDVYVASAETNGLTRKVVVKRFRNWSNFKWFPLTLWSIGTKSFTVQGKSRLEREYAINRLLHSHGIPVPNVLHVSANERLIVTEYIKGENLSTLIKEIGKTENQAQLRKDLEVIRKAGKLLAQIHSLDIVLGDSKPENILVSEKEEELYLADLEQAGRNGDKSWDIAEFIYYAGHDISPFAATDRIETMAKAFLRGYIKQGGEPTVVERAGSPKYTKVFSVFTFPHIMLLLSNICRKVDTLQTNEVEGTNNQA
jgi:tRNA A-37 threonylcarbamoyl transferase component Bud32